MRFTVATRVSDQSSNGAQGSIGPVVGTNTFGHLALAGNQGFCTGCGRGRIHRDSLKCVRAFESYLDHSEIMLSPACEESALTKPKGRQWLCTVLAGWVHRRTP